MFLFFVLVIQLPPLSTRTDPLFPCTTLYRCQLMRDQVIDVDLAVHIPVDDFWHIGTAARAAKGRTFPFAAGDQLEGPGCDLGASFGDKSEEHTSALQSLMRISYAVFCLQKHKHSYQRIT